MIATLFGYTIPAQMNSRWDHAYVISNIGQQWGCFGRDAGGLEICSGQGDSVFADCLSKPIHQPLGAAFPLVYAGIKYLITGVCHQAANRILHPAAGTLVAQARGYGLSVLLYGHYGLGTWRELAVCANLHSRGGPSLSKSGSAVNSSDQKTTQLSRKIHDIYTNQPHILDRQQPDTQALDLFLERITSASNGLSGRRI